MQLLPGESKIATLGNITLTTRRVQYEKSEWGSKKITTIPLDHLTSCDIEAHSKPRWIVLGALTAVLALYTQWSMLWGLSILFVLAWLLTLHKSMVVRSASEKIEYVGSFGQWAALQEFLQKVHVAKGSQESAATGRHEEMLAVLRASAVQAAAPSPREEVIKDVELRTPVPDPISSVSRETPILPAHTAFWITSSSTLHVRTSSSSAAPAIGREGSGPEETTTEPKPSLESPASEKDTSADVASGSVFPNISVSSPLTEIEVESPALPNSEPPNLLAVDAMLTAGQSTDAYSPLTKSTKSHTRIVVFALGALPIAVILGAVIVVFRSRPVDLFAPANRALVTTELQKWSESFRMGDTDAHVNCYAPVIETYFKMHQLPKEQLLRDKQKAFASISAVTLYELSNIQLSAEPNNRIAATFQKDWDYSVNSGKGFLGSEIEKLTFENFSGEWKIIREEEIRIVRAAHPARDDARLDQTTATQAGAFRYAKSQSSYLAEELCSESAPVSSHGRYCYPYGWRPWLKELERNVAGTEASALDGDTGTQTPGNLVIWWNSEPRIVFSGCRPHDCPDAGAYFIVAPRTRQMDIAWHNEKGVSYLGPNAALLRSRNGFTLLEQIERGETDQN